MQSSIILSIIDIQGNYSIDNDLNSLNKNFLQVKKRISRVVL